MQPVARLARFAVADSVRQHDEKFRRIKWLIFTEQFAGKFRANKLRAAAGCPVHDEHCVLCFALRIFLRFPDGSIMDTQLRQRFARGKFEIVDCEVGFDRRRVIGCERESRGQDRRDNCENSDFWIHINVAAAVRPGFA